MWIRCQDGNMIKIESLDSIKGEVREAGYDKPEENYYYFYLTAERSKTTFDGEKEHEEINIMYCRVDALNNGFEKCRNILSDIKRLMWNNAVHGMEFFDVNNVYANAIKKYEK